MLGIPVVGGCVVWVQPNGLAVLVLGSLPVPVVVLDNQRKGGMRLGEVRVDSQRVQGGISRLRHVFGLRSAGVAANQCITVGQSSIGERVFRILGDRLLKIIDGPLESWNAPFVPEVDSSQVQVM